MDLLVLGGTAWVGREIARAALDRGHTVTCLARGTSGAVPEGARPVFADRDDPDACSALGDGVWDAVVDLSSQPGHVRRAVAALHGRYGHWTMVSTCSVYVDHATPGADETAVVHEPTPLDVVDGDRLYGAAKVACEQAVVRGSAPSLRVRAGLIGGPGDHTGRSGYWVVRAARDPHAPMLVPDLADLPVSVVDVRDLAAWVVRAAQAATTGVMDAVGPPTDLGRWIALARDLGGHTGPVHAAPVAWLRAAGVAEWAGEGSLPLCVYDDDWRALMDRDGTAARAAGLTHRPLRETVADLLAWETRQGLHRPRGAGLTPRRERELLAAWEAAG